MWLQSLEVLRQHRFSDVWDQALIRQIDRINLDLGGFLIKQVLKLLLGESTDRDIGLKAQPLEMRPNQPSTL